MANRQLVKIFDDMASGLELLGANPFRSNAFSRAARTLRDMTQDVEDLVKEDTARAESSLSSLAGVGGGMARRILEFVETGAIREHQELMEKVPRGLFEVLAIPGLGPKAVKLMWEELGITSVSDLEEKLDSGQLESLPRMGKKSVDNVRKALEFSQAAGERAPLGVAHTIAVELVDSLRRVPGVQRVDYAGSLRRGRETIGDVDLLVTTQDPEAVREAFTTLPSVTQVLARGESKCSVRLKVEWVTLQADLRLVPEESYGAALLYFTGSKEHNVRLREIAIRENKHLNEYGLYPGTEARPQDAGIQPLAGATEEEIYGELGLPWIPPELREDQGELKQVPGELVEMRHIRAELHAHTRASDGRLTLHELAAAAQERGFHTLAVTDHSQSSVIANGLSPDRLRRHVDAVRELNEDLPDITLLAGAEVDILADGRLDYDDELLALLDIVVASPHAALRQSSQKATERLLRAIRHPLVHILGHPTGRVLGKRRGLTPDMKALFQAAAEHDTVLEINANWRRLDLRDSHVKGAVEHGCRLAVNTDAHYQASFDYLIYGILTARRGGLEAKSCINTWPARKLHAWLRSKR